MLSLLRLIAIHRHALRVPAQLALCCRADRSATSMSTSCATFFECEQLLSSEGFVVDLAGGLDQVL